MITEEQIDILNESVEQMTEERAKVIIGLLRERVAWYEGQNAQLAAENDGLRDQINR
jgi:hypothetical protein